MSSPVPADTAPGYVERLWPGPWVWLCGLLVAGALGVAYGAALGAIVGWAVGLAAAAVVVVILLLISSVVAVRPDGLAAGRALLPWSAVGTVVAVDGAGRQRALGPGGDRSAFMVLRPGVGPGAVVVEITDPEDPHGTWLIASRDPRAMARAIEETRGRLTA